MTDLWNQILNETPENKDWSDMDSEVQEEINEHIDEYRPRFEEEFEDANFPRHPYKIMMEIRKEKGLYGGNSHEKPKLIRALKILKDEYEEKWGEMANA